MPPAASPCPASPPPLHPLPPVHPQVIVPDRLEPRIELVHQRNAVRNVQADDIGVAHAVEVFDERADAVAVGRDQQPLAAEQHRGEGRIPKRQHAVDGSFRHSVAGICSAERPA